jgi:DNA-binding SARP family transcriptional activator/TolB-like protein/Flp pilus assembly protein TadD
MPKLKLLGGARLEDESGVVTGPASHRHTLALLGLLASVRPGGIPRGKLVGYLWPEVPERTARNRLNTLVHRVRKALGKDVLRSVKSELVLGGDAITSDLEAFQAALERDDLESAAAHYAGPFMDGFHLAGSNAFDRWIEATREELRQRHRRVLEALADAAAAQEEWDQAARWRGRVARDAPLDSRAVAELMDALVAAGNPAGALAAARRHEELLQEELGTTPADEVLRLVRRIRSKSNGHHVDPGGPPGPRKAIAILPFETQGGGQEAELFAEGLHLDLLTQLSRMPDLSVVSRASVLQYRDHPAPIHRVGAQLGVGAVLEGVVRQHRDRVRFTVQLVDVASDASRWGETYDRDFTPEALFDIQADLARKVAASLRSAMGLGNADLHHRAWLPTDNVEAYRLHLRGRRLLATRQETPMRRAVDYFQRAIERAPEYAAAWGGLADALTYLETFGFVTPPDAIDAARAATRALELDPASAEAHFALSNLAHAQRLNREAIRRAERAIELRPSYSDAYNLLSWMHKLHGRAKTGLTTAQRAVALDPLGSAPMANLILAQLAIEDFEAALKEARNLRELHPDFSAGPFLEALALYHTGRFAEAARLLRGLTVSWAGAGPAATLALSEIAMGDSATARQTLAGIDQDVHPFSAALVRTALPEARQTVEAFTRIREWTYWPTLAVHYFFPAVLNPLRRDGCYEGLLQQVDRSWGL